MAEYKDYDYEEPIHSLIETIRDDNDDIISERVVAKDIGADGLKRDVDTGEVSMVVWAKVHGKKVTRCVTLDKLQPKALMELAKYGFPFHVLNDTKIVSQWLIYLIKKLILTETTKELGWKETDEGERYFQTDESISKTDDIHVEYEGNLMVESKGKYDTYVKIVEDEVIPYHQLQAILVFSVSAALSALIDRDLTLIIHMNGNSSTGKTTATRLAASVWGSTEIAVNGMVQTWHTTQNATIHDLCGIKGITMCFDELGVNKSDTTNLIYLLANGTDKKRMGSTDPPKTFSVNVCSSGEIPMKTVEGVNGTDVRLLEFNVPWTASKEHSERLTDRLAKCYGHLGKEFVKVLIKIPESTIRNTLKKYEEIIMTMFKEEYQSIPDRKKNIFRRAVKKIAAVAVTSQILNKKLGFKFNTEEIVKFMITKSSLLNISQEECVKFLDDVLNYMSASECKTDFYGLSRQEKIMIKKNFYIIEKGAFLSFAKGAGYKSIRDINDNLTHLKRLGFMHCEKGKLYNRRIIKGNNIQCYEFYISKLEDEAIKYKEPATSPA